MIKAKKSLSQNFIIDQNICKKIINQTKVKNRLILEIGPGYGFMTDHILKGKPKKIILIEKDIELTKFLNKKYKDNKIIKIINKDFLKYDLKKHKNLTVISNLPYNVSTKIILYLFNYNQNISEMIFMIQKEVSQKFDYNLPKMNKYKFLTKFVSSYSRCFEVSNNVFLPKPKVTSSVVKFKFKKTKYDLKKAILFCNFIFKNVRKKINNNIKLKQKNELLNKRVSEISIDELFVIYNLF